MRSRCGSSSPPSSRPSRSVCSALASPRERRSSTTLLSGKLADLLQVDAVLGYYHLQVRWRSAQVAAPLPVEDLRVLGVGFEYYSLFGLVQHGRVLGELAPPDGIAAVDRVPRPEALHARRRGVQLLGNPLVPPPLLDPAPDLGRVRL